jgi:hypothetical protein
MTARPEREGFRIWDAEQAVQAEEWIRLWETLPSGDIHAHPHYVRLFCRPGDRALCAAWESAQGRIVFPFVLRDLRREPYGAAAGKAACDLTTPYGYGGGACWDCPAPESLADSFWEAFDSWAAACGLVTEFVRFPLFVEHPLPYRGESSENRKVVARDLRPSTSELVESFSSNTRRNLRKAGRCNLAVECDRDGQNLSEFLRIYEDTMRRRNADAAYFFPRAFFEQLQHGLPGQYAYFHARHGGRVVSSELLLLSRNTAYFFLGGSDVEALPLSANFLLQFEIMRWAASQGKRWYVLGGGYRPDDGIFHYKQGFAPQGAIAFRVGSRVHDAEACRRLVDARRGWAQCSGEAWQPRPDFFPPYRA